MRAVSLSLLFCSIAGAASFTSVTTGNWNANATWGGGSFPGNGDTVTIADGTVVTCPTSVTCTFGTSGAGGTNDLTIGQGGASTAKLIVNGTLVARGGITSNPLTSVRTGGYCALTLGAGSTFTWDAHLATTPLSQNYSYTATANAWDAIICSNGTANAGDSTGITTGGNHVTITSDVGGGNGYFSATSGGPWNHTFSYTDLTRIGDASHRSILAYGATTGSYTQLLSLDRVTLTSSGGIYVDSVSATSNFSVTHSVCSDTKPNSILSFCFAIGSMANATGGSSRIFSYNSSDASFNNPASFTPLDSVTLTNNMMVQPTVIVGTYRWAAFTNNLITFTFQSDPFGSEFNTAGDMDGLYMYWYADVGHRHWWTPTGHARATYSHILMDSDVTIAGCNTTYGSDILLTGSGGDTPLTDFPLSYSIVLPPAKKGCSPGSILQPIGSSPLITLSINHNTVYAGQQGITIENTDNLAPYIGGITNNIFFSPPGYGAEVGSNKMVVTQSGQCTVDQVPPASADYNASWNILQNDPALPGCFLNSGKGYWGNFSTMPGVHDKVISDPQFVDISRDLATYDTAGLGHSPGTAWSVGTSYTVGQIVSHQSAYYRNNSVVNFINIKAYTAGAAPCDSDVAQQCSEPGGPTPSSANGANWRIYWEPATFKDIRDGLYSGALFGGVDVLTAMRNWVTAGYSPQNRAVCQSAGDGTDMGAVPCATTLPLQITGPLGCQQGQSCAYKTTGGTPPYTYSMVTGSVGSINASSGAYSAPAHVIPHNTINGCQSLPNNSVFNTKIDALPADTSSTLWINNTDGNYGAGIGSAFRAYGSVSNSTDQPVGMNYVYSPNPAISIQYDQFLNGEGHSFEYHDGSYVGTDPFGLGTGSGDPTVSLSPLSGSKGYFADDIGTLHGPNNPFSDLSGAWTVIGGTWSSGTATLTLNANPTNLSVGDYVSIEGVDSTHPINPATFQNLAIQLSAVDHALHTVSWPASSGSSWVSGGIVQKTVAFHSQVNHFNGWALDDQNGNKDFTDTFATVIRKLDAPANVTSVDFYFSNFNTIDTTSGVSVPATIDIDFGNDGVTWGDAVPTYTTTAPDRALSGSGVVTVQANKTNAYVWMRVRMTHLGYATWAGGGFTSGGGPDNWIFLSNINAHGNGTSMIFQPFPDRISETGAAWTEPGLFAIYDNHYLTTTKDTCAQSDVYKYYSAGVYDAGPATNSASGVTYDLKSNVLPPFGTDAAQMLLTPNLITLDELLAAAAGDVHAIKHTVRFDLDAASMNTNANIWPAQSHTSSGCQARNIVGHGTTTVTPDMPSFCTSGHCTSVMFYNWPSSTAITIDGTPYTVISVATDGLSMVVSGTVGSGAHTMGQPNTNCMPYGSRLRLKSSFTWPHVFTVTVAGSTVTVNDPVNDFFPLSWSVFPGIFTLLNTNGGITINGTPYTLASAAAGGGSITLTTTPPAPSQGVQSMTITNQYFDGNCNTRCKNIVAAVIQAQKDYGLILADAGTSWSGNGYYGYGGYDVAQAMNSLAAKGSNVSASSYYNGLVGGYQVGNPSGDGCPTCSGDVARNQSVNNYEVVDESSLNTNQTYTGASIAWGEAMLREPTDPLFHVVPSDAAVVKVTDSLSATALYSVALQGVAIGVPHPNEPVMAGASAFQMQSWVTGTSNGAVTWALSPSGGANGTITSGGIYTPAVSGLVTTLTQTTATVTSVADNTVSKAVTIQIFPLSSDGKLHLSLGKSYGTGSPFYTDTAGVVWWNDQVAELSPVAISPDDFGFSFGAPWTSFAGDDGYTTQAPGIYALIFNNYNDHHFRIHVANGPVTGTALLGNLATAINQQGFSFDCNGVIVNGNTDQFTYTGAVDVVRPLSCTQTVVDGTLHMVVRDQGTNLGLNPSCLIPCYVPGSLNLVSGIVIGATAPTPGNGTTISGHTRVSGSVVVR